MTTDSIRLEVKNWITLGIAIVALIVVLVVGVKALPFYGIAFGIALILDAIFYWRLFVTVRDSSKAEYRWSCGIIGLLFIVLSILTLLGVIGV